MANTSPATPTYPDPLEWRGGEVITSAKLSTLLQTVNHLMENQGAQVVYSESYPDDVFFWDDVEPDDPHLSIIVPILTDQHTTLRIRAKVSEDGASGSKAVRFFSRGANASSVVSPEAGGAQTWKVATREIAAIDGEDQEFDVIDVFLSTTGDGLSLHNLSIEIDPPGDLDTLFTTTQSYVPVGDVVYTGSLFGDTQSDPDYPLTAGRARAIIRTLNHLVRRPRVYQNFSAIRGLGAGLFRPPSTGLVAWPIDVHGQARERLDVFAAVVFAAGADDFGILRLGATRWAAVVDPDVITVRRVDPPGPGFVRFVNAGRGLNPLGYAIASEDSAYPPDPADANLTQLCLWGP